MGSPNAGCEIPECDRRHEARGLCAYHYERARRRGEIDVNSDRARKPQRIWPRRSVGAHLRDVLLERSEPADDGSGCRRWLGAHFPKGYGLISVDGLNRPVHRVAYEQFVGSIPENHEIDHVAVRGCRHRDCIEPRHLEPVTHQENCRRIVRKPQEARGVA